MGTCHHFISPGLLSSEPFGGNLILVWHSTRHVRHWHTCVDLEWSIKAGTSANMKLDPILFVNICCFSAAIKVHPRLMEETSYIRAEGRYCSLWISYLSRLFCSRTVPCQEFNYKLLLFVFVGAETLQTIDLMWTVTPMAWVLYLQILVWKLCCAKFDIDIFYSIAILVILFQYSY